MRTFTKAIIAAAVAAGAASLGATASADIVCSTADNVCWHVHRHHYEYKPDFGVVVHPDSWTWSTDDHYTWKEHEGRGYWRDGVWVTF